MEILVMVAQLLLGLSILVGLHELGHLIAAKVFGMRVEKYSIGFPPKIFGVQIGETEYSLGAIPLGGFVKISGMIDESLDTTNLSEEPQPWEFRAKPAWQRLIVMMGGIIVNVITGIIIFVIIVYNYGESYIPKEEVNKHGIVAFELGKKIGLQTGDRIINVNGKDYAKFSELTSPGVLLSDDSYYTVERNGQAKRIDIPNNFIEHLSDKNARGNFIDLPYPFSVADIEEGSGAEKAGLKKGDKIISANGQKITFFHEFRETLGKNINKTVPLEVERDGKVVNLTAKVSDKGTLGFFPKLDDTYINYSTINYSFAEAIPKGTQQAFNVVWVNIKAFGKIINGDVSPRKAVSGPVGIAKIFGGIWDWRNFWNITGLLSMVLAFMNFLPIPALDGGHVMFLLYEMVSGRKPSDKFLEVAQKVGMVILLGLMAFAFFNDIIPK